MTATLALPLSAQELRAAVREARPYNPKSLDRVLRLDAKFGIVEAQGCASWTSVLAQANPEGRALAAWAEMPSIDESLAGNLPGPDGRPVSCHVESLTLVTPDGELRRLSRTVNGELFALVLGGQGLFGALYSATLKLDSIARAAADAAPAETLTLSGAPTATARVLSLLLPPESLDAFLAKARAICDDWRVAIEGVQARAVGAEEDSALRWARRDYALLSQRLAQPGAIGGAVRGLQLRRELIDAAIEHGGSFPIACTPDASRAQVERCYPAIKTFLAEKRRIDPAEKLSSEWYRHMRSLLARESCESRWTS
jgi:FAD/FMN-containing dehydrogenase